MQLSTARSIAVRAAGLRGQPVNGVGKTCFHHVVIKIWQSFLRPVACLTSTLLETEVRFLITIA
jgi:hypothetical protein